MIRRKLVAAWLSFEADTTLVCYVEWVLSAAANYRHVYRVSLYDVTRGIYVASPEQFEREHEAEDEVMRLANLPARPRLAELWEEA